MYSSAKDQTDVIRAELNKARRQCQQEGYAARHAVEAHGRQCDKYHESVSKLHRQLNKLREEKASAESTMSIREYDIAAMKREYEKEVSDRGAVIAKHESHTYFEITGRARTVGKMEILENELNAAKSEMTVSHRLQIRDRATDAEVARAKAEIQLIEKTSN